MDVIQLTYTELAERRGCRLDTARALVRRHEWPKITGNDGVVRIAVPAEFLDPPPPTPRPAPVQQPQEQRPSDTELQELRDRLIESEKARAVAETKVEMLQATLLHERKVAAELRADLRELQQPWWRKLWPTRKVTRDSQGDLDQDHATGDAPAGQTMRD